MRMEEALIRRPTLKQKLSASLDPPTLFHIPADSAAVAKAKAMPVFIEAQSFKDKLVYGSLDSPTRSLHFPFDPRSLDDADNHNYGVSLFSPRTLWSFNRRAAVGDAQRTYNDECGSPRDLESSLKDVRAKDSSENIEQDESKEAKKPWLIQSLVNPEFEDEYIHHPIRRFFRKSLTEPAWSLAFTKKDRLKKPQLKSISPIVMQASIGLAVYLLVGVLIYIWKRKEFSGSTTDPIIDALYFCIVTLCTIGYGDIAPLSTTAKLFSCAFVLVGFGFIDILLSGMVDFVLERQETLLLSAIKGSHYEMAKNYLVNTKEGRMHVRMKVGLAMLVVIACLGIGTSVMHRLERLSWLDSFYLACMSVTTVGYGDHAFQSMHGRLFAAIWLLVSTLAVARAFLFFAEARIDQRNRLIAKWVLHRQMTVGDLVAADLDNNSYVSKSELVVYKLKEMGKISEIDIHEICVQFNNLDTDNSGRITLSRLMNI